MATRGPAPAEAGEAEQAAIVSGVAQVETDI